MNFKQKIAEKSQELPEVIRVLTLEESKSVSGGDFGKGCNWWSDGNGFTQVCEP